MNNLPCGPVAWSDGMLIEVQHFQQAERNLAHQTHLRLGQSQNHGWGFSVLEVDEDGLGLGRMALRKAKGVFQDGTAFAMPSHDSLPPALDTEGAQAGDQICLVVQAARTGGAEMAFGTDPVASRFRAVDTEVPDLAAGLEATGAPRRITMQTGRLQTRLCLASRVRADEVALPIARVSGRRNANAILLDSRFIPPLLDARAHVTLGALIEELQSVLRVRLAGGHSLRSLAAGGGVADLIEMLLRQALAEYRLRLGHLESFDPLPPALLHHELIGLLGRLSVMPGVEEEMGSQEFRYLHDDPQSSFDPLAATLRRALARVIETPLLQLRFEDRGDQVHVCVLDRQWKLQKLIFAVSAAMPAEQIRKLLPQQAKLGAVEQIQKLVDFQLPGARLTALAHPPRIVPYYAQSVYFEVDCEGPNWDSSIAGSALALRIVGEFPEIRFEAWGLRESKVS
jgi:type VI secretion system protein ImpJ